MKRLLLAVFSMVLMASSFSSTYANKYWIQNLKINMICHQTNDNHGFVFMKTQITNDLTGDINNSHYNLWNYNNGLNMPSPYLFSASTTTNKLIYAGLLNAYATDSYVDIQFEDDYASGATKLLWVLVHK